MTLAATFLGGAKSRLLPLSIPFRFFAAAAAFQVLAWIALLAAAGETTSFRGGPGPALAALHLLTLGVLTTSAAGASIQLLPVATRRSLAAVWPVRLLFWLLVPGLSLLVAGMYAADVRILIAGALVASAALVLFAILLGDNLRRAGALAIVAAYGWAALFALLALAAIGLALAGDYTNAILSDHNAAALAHMILGGFGFMGLLALGFSHILVPMFALSAPPDRRWTVPAFVAAVAAIVLGTLGALADSRNLLTIAALVGLCAVGAHLALMRKVLACGMRKRLGLSFVLIRIAWTILPLTLVVGLAALYGLAGPNGPTLFGFLLLVGWLLTFLLGILQRIVPFLASMHASGSRGAPPPLSELAASWPLKLHAICHTAALGVLASAILLNNVALARIGGASGLAGALAFAWFIADVLRRVLRSRNP